MIRDGVINRKEGIEILQKFLQYNFDFDKLASYHDKKRTKQQLTKFVKSKFKQIILQIQYQLYNCKKIKALKFFDNSSEEMFEEILKMKDNFPKNLYNDFLFEQKCKYLKIEKSSTKKKMEIYSVFAKYAQDNNLFNLAQQIHIEEQEQVIKDTRPYQNPFIMYTYSELELICLYYETCVGNLKEIKKCFTQRSFLSNKFVGELLQENLQNLMLIGLHRCLIKSKKSNGYKDISWSEFVKEGEEYLAKIQNWHPNFKLILIQIAARDDCRPFQIKIICQKLNRKYNDKPCIQALELPPFEKSTHKINTTPEIRELKEQLLKVLKSKIYFDKAINFG